MHPRRFFPLFSLGSLAALTCLFTSTEGCSEVRSPARVLVSRVPSGSRASREEGETINLTRWDFDDRPGLTRGFMVVESESEWRGLWPDTEADRIPLLPQGMDFTREFLLVAAPTEKLATDVRIKQVIDTPENGLHVYVTRALPGEGCPPSEEKEKPVQVDLARMRRIEHKEFHFHVETVHEEACAPPPESKIACRVNGTSTPFETHLTIEPGKSVSCLSEGKAGFRATIDRTWSFRTLPLGTAAKMTIASGSAGVTFNTDAFGTYSLGLEVTDDLGRHSSATTDVNVAPRKDALVVQMLWTKFEPTDDPSTFPRVELHVVGEKPPAAADLAKYGKFAARSTPWILVKGDCTLGDNPPAWCKARVVGPTTIAELALDAEPEYRIGVHYTDERVDGQPVLCVRTFRGSVAGEWCDKTVRQAGHWWDVTRVDAQTGKVPVPPAPPAPAASASAAPLGSAAPVGSAAPSGSAAVKPAPSAAPKPAASAPPKPRGSADPWTP